MIAPRKDLFGAECGSESSGHEICSARSTGIKFHHELLTSRRDLFLSPSPSRPMRNGTQSARCGTVEIDTSKSSSRSKQSSA